MSESIFLYYKEGYEDHSFWMYDAGTACSR
jgi:hypothetical protein